MVSPSRGKKPLRCLFTFATVAFVERSSLPPSPPVRGSRKGLAGDLAVTCIVSVCGPDPVDPGGAACQSFTASFLSEHPPALVARATACVAPNPKRQRAPVILGGVTPRHK